MSTSARWVVIGVGMVIALGAASLVLVNASSSPASPERGPKTWLLQPGQTLRVPADQVLMQDTFRCASDGSTEMPKHWHPFAGSDLSSMVVDAEGNVTVYCVQDPLGNA